MKSRDSLTLKKSHAYDNSDDENMRRSAEASTASRRKYTESEYAYMEMHRGSKTQQYLNSYAPVLLEGLDILEKVRPENPLRWLGEYYLQRSQSYDPQTEIAMKAPK